MSAKVRTMLYCDKCGAGMYGVESNRVQVNETRKLAVDYGWKVPKRSAPFCKDLCPACANPPKPGDAS